MPHPVLARNHVAVITGGASGIGFAAAVRFIKAGMRVCVADLGRREAVARRGAPEPGRARRARTT